MKQTIGGILYALGLLSVILGAVIQMAVSLTRYGFVIESMIIKHWSLWFYCGVLPMIVGYVLLKMED